MSHKSETQPTPVLLSFTDIGRAIRRQTRFIAVMFVAVLLLPLLYLHIAVYTYTVTLDVVSARQGNSAQGGNLGQLASLANIPLMQGAMDRDFELYLEGLKSREVARLLMTRNPELVQAIFVDEWDAPNKRWRPPGVVHRTISRVMSILVGMPYNRWSPPSAERLQEYLSARLRVSRTRDNPVVSIDIDVNNPGFGIRLLWALHKSVDGYLKERAIQRNTLYINYITQMLKEVSLEEHRQALIQTLSSTERARMMASSDLDYAAESFGMPVASMRPTKPNAFLILVVFALVGLFSSTFLAVLRDRKGKADLNLPRSLRPAVRGVWSGASHCAKGAENGASARSVD